MSHNIYFNVQHAYDQHNRMQFTYCMLDTTLQERRVEESPPSLLNMYFPPSSFRSTSGPLGIFGIVHMYRRVATSTVPYPGMVVGLESHFSRNRAIPGNAWLEVFVIDVPQCHV